MGLTSDLENKVKKYLEFVWHQEERENPELYNHFLSKLSSTLRDEIYNQTNVKFLRMIPVFCKSFSDETMLNIAKIMKKVRFSPEEYVYRVNIIYDKEKIFLNLINNLYCKDNYVRYYLVI